MARTELPVPAGKADVQPFAAADGFAAMLSTNVE
jgi:hypothetical protein